MIIQPNRRAFLRGASVSSLGLTSLGLMSACSPAAPDAQSADTSQAPGDTDLWGVQLYTVRDLFEADARSTLEALAQIGIKDCETAGLFEHSAADIRTIMDDNGLTSRSGHLRLEALRDDAGFASTLEDAATLGQDRLYLGWIPEEERSLDKYRALAELLNRRGEEAKAAGMMIGYHNHEFEFVEEGGVKGYDILLGETQSDLVTMELDLYWVTHAGLDPSPILQATPDRFSSLHVKDRAKDGEMVSAGAGEIDFASILPLAKSLGADRWYIEHDNPAEPLVSIGRSYTHLTALS